MDPAPPSPATTGPTADPTTARPIGLGRRVLTTRPPWWGRAHVVFAAGLCVAAGSFEALEPRELAPAVLTARCAPLGADVLGPWGAGPAAGPPPFVELSITVRRVGGLGWRAYTMTESARTDNMTGAGDVLLGPAVVERSGGVEIRTRGQRPDVFTVIGRPEFGVDGGGGGGWGWWAERLEARDPAAARSPLVEDAALAALLRGAAAAERAKVIAEPAAIGGAAVRNAWRAGLWLGVGVMAAAGVLAAARAMRRTAARARLEVAGAGRCMGCGYARAGLDPGAPCPECGTEPGAARAEAWDVLGETPPPPAAPT